MGAFWGGGEWFGFGGGGEFFKAVAFSTDGATSAASPAGGRAPPFSDARAGFGFVFTVAELGRDEAGDDFASEVEDLLCLSAENCGGAAGECGDGAFYYACPGGVSVGGSAVDEGHVGGEGGDSWFRWFGTAG